ncbi:putative neutral zinc metallopeptidase [Haloactinospora alba]|uniref:Putative neutral zinc metallopeptidase n=1 Tax=Haloactinospora alba TaxID=405555 RepID=A0A543NJ75_9ACTN|nr:neutral zinc metallopeptidase [Haloactinospora alba]TQN31911.1 putative neutral zinc metallopeptidase [Haloactinospora alba]
METPQTGGQPPGTAQTPPCGPAGPQPAGPPPAAPPPPPRQDGPPPARGSSTATIAVAAGGATFAAVTALAVGATILVNATDDPAATEGKQETPDLSRHYERSLDDAPSAVDVDVAAHPLYGASPPEPNDCDLPRVDTSSSASWEAFSQDIGDCLNDMWQPRLSELGIRKDAPSFKASSDIPDDTPQEGMTLAYYKDREPSITVVIPNVAKLARHVPEEHQQGVWSALLAHEYGHHVQHATGILQRTAEMEEDAPAEEEALNTLRRTELQAECLGGAAMGRLGTFQDSELEEINRFLNGGSDLETHGSAANRQYWFEQGTAGGTLDGCNTFDADRSRVR